MRKAITLLALCGLLAGCGVGFGQSGFSDTGMLTGEVAEVKIDGSSGDVTLHHATGDKITVYREVRYSGTHPGSQLRHRLEGQTLVLDGTCGVNCSISYTVNLPGRPKISGKLASGDLHAQQTGPVDMTTASGDITLNDVAGPVKLDTASGTVTAKLTTVGDVRADTASGDVTVSVPDDDYRVQTKSASGSRRVSLNDRPDAQHTITVSTGSGDIKLARG
ncbi:hypothetical protein D5S17_32655 [Pseudonocardiaceae bacterium YIM PH 21723]|nr:hypothetical protein D5S17_32655 [Pseudonocardiaceae bacterium YIM PH 21723]